MSAGIYIYQESTLSYISSALSVVLKLFLYLPKEVKEEASTGN